MLVVFMACTLMAGECREIVLPLADGVVTPFGCVRSGQLVMAEWLRDHAHSHKVTGGYRCTPPSRLARSI